MIHKCLKTKQTFHYTRRITLKHVTSLWCSNRVVLKPCHSAKATQLLA